MPAYSTLERAFQIACAREAMSLGELREQLAREGYNDALAQTSFPLIRRQLKDAMQGRVSPPKPDRRRKGGALKPGVRTRLIASIAAR